MIERIVLLGGGGHGKVLISAARAKGFQCVGVLDDDPHLQGGELLGVPILGPISMALEMTNVSFLTAIGNGKIRRTFAEHMPNLEWATVIHPSAWVDPAALIGAGSVICAGAVVQAEARIGRHCIVNTSASIDHDCLLGDYVHVAPGCRLGGGVQVEEGVFLGIGTCIIPGTRVGAWSQTGAGTTLVADIPSGVLAVGCPGRVIRRM